MIFCVPTKYLAGITIFGDFYDLKSLYQTISDLVEVMSISEDMKDTILGLAYDIRHAYQRSREEETFGSDDCDRVTYQGVKVLWPIVLFQANVLRSLASFYPTTKEHQANLYRFESSLESALNQVDRNVAVECIEWLSNPLPLSLNYYCLYLNEAAKKYIMESSGKKRFKKLPTILRSFHPLSSEYRIFANYLESIANEKGCSPQNLYSSDEYDIKW